MRRSRDSGTRRDRGRAAGQVCVDLPGKGPLCFRLINDLGVGACTIAFPHAARLPVPLEARVHIAHAGADMSNLVELCEHYLKHPAEREAMRMAAQKYCDDCLRTMLDRLS